MSKVPFPDVLIGEFTVFRRFTAPGLFAYRHIQAYDLLRFPEFSGSDLPDDLRKEALEMAVNLHRPLAALALFLGVVGLEDFIRDFAARLARVAGISQYFPMIEKLTPSHIGNVANYARPDKDPVTFSNWPKVNLLFDEVFKVRPISPAILPKLHDLALIRHTVAHHAALVRSIDVPRFQYWTLQAGVLINPPAPFVRETLSELFQVGKDFQAVLADCVFARVIPQLPEDWPTSPSNFVLSLLETFDWFGKIVTDERPPPLPGSPIYKQELIARDAEYKARLVGQAIEELRMRHS